MQSAEQLSNHVNVLEPVWPNFARRRLRRFVLTSRHAGVHGSDYVQAVADLFAVVGV